MRDYKVEFEQRVAYIRDLVEPKLLGMKKTMVSGK